MSSNKSSNDKKTKLSNMKPLVLDTYSITIITIIYNILVFCYIIKLEDKKCNCIQDWRHDFIKNYCIIIIVWSIITLLFNIQDHSHEFVILMSNVIMFISLINIWCLYTYVGDLDKTDCKCATYKQKDMHYFLYIWRYILVGSLVLLLIGILANALSM